MKMSETKEVLIHNLEIACWAFYHVHIGTVEHLNSKNRVYKIADELINRFGVSNDELALICERQMN